MRFAAALLLVVSSLAACTPTPAPDDGGTPGDGGALVDGGGGGTDAGPVGDAGQIDNPWGFAMRAPQQRTLPCDDAMQCPNGTFATRDVDYVCTLTAFGHDAVVYVAATPTEVDATFFPLPIYDDVRAWVAENDAIVEVDAAYDFGGNHNNDNFTLTIDGVDVTWDHSSYGFGFRACQPPDCVRDGTTDGCQPTRTLGEACIEVADPLPPLVDNFMTCAGDPG